MKCINMVLKGMCLNFFNLSVIVISKGYVNSNKFSGNKVILSLSNVFRILRLILRETINLTDPGTGEVHHEL